MSFQGVRNGQLQFACQESWQIDDWVCHCGCSRQSKLIACSMSRHWVRVDIIILWTLLRLFDDDTHMVFIFQLLQAIVFAGVVGVSP